MAIEKGVDTVKKEEVLIDQTVEVDMPQEFQDGGDVNIEMTDDGGAEIDFDPSSRSQPCRVYGRRCSKQFSIRASRKL